MNDAAIVLHSGGMDSSICLGIAIDRFGKDQVISLGFDYRQRHVAELQAASAIASIFGVRRKVLRVPMLFGWEESSMVNAALAIEKTSKIPNSFVPARNGLFLLMAAPLARQLGAHYMYIGVMELEGANSGYPDCSRAYIDAVQTVVRLDISNPLFSIETPLIHMTKRETMSLANDLGILDVLLQYTVTCYQGIKGQGCMQCPACKLRSEGLQEFYTEIR